MGRRSSLPVCVFCFLLFLGALVWARGRDPFDRRWFAVRAAGNMQCVAVLPKTAPRPLGTVVYLHGAGGSVLGSGNEMRQMAEMGLAVLGMEHCQTNQAVAEAQLAALRDYLERQGWADTSRLLKVVAREGGLQVEGYRVQVESTNALGAMRVGSTGDGPSSAESLLTQFSPVEPVTFNLHPVTFPLAGEERLGVFRRVGEYCLVRLKGEEALESYQSISEWQAEAKPLWLCWTPAAAWAALACYWPRRSDLKARTRISRIDTKDPGSIPPPSDLRFTLHVLRVSWLTWAAVVLAAAALAVTGIHLITPRLAVSERTLGMARRVLVSEQERGDFEWLAGQGIWEGERLGTLLEHMQLAGYNRELVNWKVEQEIYREYVLSPVIGTGAGLHELHELHGLHGLQGLVRCSLAEPGRGSGGITNRRDAKDAEKTKAEGRNRKVTEIGNRSWRRVLWESFYPRIRKEESPEAAAEIVGRYLRERMTVLGESRELKAESGNPREDWRRQVTDGAGFEVLSVAGLRAVGIGARLDGEGRAEFWTGDRWRGNNNKVTK